MAGYACRVVSENFQAIASEKPDFDLEELLEWIAVHDSGYFLRDSSSPFDCQFIQTDVFHELYIFTDDDPNGLYRRVVKV